MKKTTKPATREETKTKPKTKSTVKAKTGQKTKASEDAKVKKVTRTKEMPASTAKPKTKAVIKTKSKSETTAKTKVKTKAETKAPAKTKPVAKKKEAAEATPKKTTAAVKLKLKPKIVKKPLKVAAPVKATKKVVLKSPLKSPLKKVVSPKKKAMVIQKKKTAPAEKAVPAAVKKKTVAAKNAKLPLKEKMPFQASPHIIKAEPSAKILSGRTSGPRPAAGSEARKPEKKPVKKIEKKSSKKPLVVTATRQGAKTEATPDAKTTTKIRAAEANKESAGKKKVRSAVEVAVPLKKPRIAGPAVPAVTEEAEDELLSVAEIEVREGRVIKPRLKIFLPREEPIGEGIKDKENKPATGREALPAKYGESEFFMIVIDPILVFLDWEIMPEDLPAEGLSLCIRIYDVTGIAFDGTNAKDFIDIGLEGLIGSGYCEIGMQGREIVAEIGFIDAHGVFIALMRSAKTSVPSLLQYDEFGIVRKMQEAGLPVGY